MMVLEIRIVPSFGVMTHRRCGRVSTKMGLVGLQVAKQEATCPTEGRDSISVLLGPRGLGRHRLPCLEI